MSRKEKKEQFLFSPQQIDSQPILNKKNIFLEYPRKRHIAHHDFNLADSLWEKKTHLQIHASLCLHCTVTMQKWGTNRPLKLLTD